MGEARETLNAIEKFDHFCPWVGNSVGARNHKWFVLFTSSTFMLALGTAGGSMYYLLVEGMNDVGLVAVVLVAYCAIISCCVGGLSAYHWGLVCRNATTNEELKDKWEGKPNPYDHGCCTNCSSILFTSARGSYMHEGMEHLQQLHATFDAEQGESTEMTEKSEASSVSGGLTSPCDHQDSSQHKAEAYINGV